MTHLVDDNDPNKSNDKTINPINAINTMSISNNTNNSTNNPIVDPGQRGGSGGIDHGSVEGTVLSSPVFNRPIHRSRTSPSSADSNNSSPRRAFSITDHPGFVLATNKMLRGSKSTTDLDVPELESLASKLRAGGGISIGAEFERSYTGVVSAATCQSTKHHPNPATSTSTDNPNITMMGGTHIIDDAAAAPVGFPYFPNMKGIGSVNGDNSTVSTEHGNDNKNTSVAKTNVHVTSGNDDIHIQRRYSSDPSVSRIEEEDGVAATYTAVENKSRGAETLVSTGVQSTSEQLEPTTSTTNSSSFSSATTSSSLFRVGIVVSDCETLLTGKYNIDAIAAIANPVSKCQLVAMCVLNIDGTTKTTRTDKEVYEVAHAWIHKNYIVGLRRHQKYVVNHSHSVNHTKTPSIPHRQRKGSTTATSNTNEVRDKEVMKNKKLGRHKMNLDYHSNMALYPGDNFVDDLDEMVGDDLDDYYSDKNDSTAILSHSKVEIVIGEDGFQRLLQATATRVANTLHKGVAVVDETNDLENDSSSRRLFVDGIYFILPDSAMQHKYAMAALHSHKHVLLNDPSSTSLNDFCEQFLLAKQVNRFLQFSTMFVNQYRVKTFLECVTSSETFGRVQSIEAILNVNYNDAHIVDEPTKNEYDGCIKRLGRYCILLSTLMLCRVALFSSAIEQEGDDIEEHKPLTAQVTSYTTTPMSMISPTGTTTIVEVPSSAHCVVQFANNRSIKFTVQYSAAPTRQVLTVRCASGRYATMSDFVIPNRDGLSNCRLYDATQKIVIPTNEGERFEVDVVCAEAVDMPSGPPQHVVMWRRFCELSGSIEQEGWEVKENEAYCRDDQALSPSSVSGNNNINNAAADDDDTVIGNSIGLDVDSSRHGHHAILPQSSLLHQQFDSFNSTSSVPIISPAALDAQEARDYTQVSIQTKCILMALTESWQLAERKEEESVSGKDTSVSAAGEAIGCEANTTVTKKKKVGVPVPIHIPNVW